MTLKLADETEKRLVASIKRFFEEEMDEPIGDLKALRVLDFCLREIAPSVYNQAIADAQALPHRQRRRPQRQQVRGGVRLLEEGLRPARVAHCSPTFFSPGSHTRGAGFARSCRGGDSDEQARRSRVYRVHRGVPRADRGVPCTLQRRALPLLRQHRPRLARRGREGRRRRERRRLRDADPRRVGPGGRPRAGRRHSRGGAHYPETSVSETSLASARLVTTYMALTAPTGTTQASQQPAARSSPLASASTGFASRLSDWIASTGEISAIRRANSGEELAVGFEGEFDVPGVLGPGGDDHGVAADPGVDRLSKLHGSLFRQGVVSPLRQPARTGRPREGTGGCSRGGRACADRPRTPAGVRR